MLKPDKESFQNSGWQLEKPYLGKYPGELVAKTCCSMGRLLPKKVIGVSWQGKKVAWGTEAELSTLPPWRKRQDSALLAE
jgi:hypothetical protein